MHYVKHFNINGVDTRQVPCIELRGIPNTATEGAVGVLGIDVTSPTKDVYKCVDVRGSIYTWLPLTVLDGYGEMVADIEALKVALGKKADDYSIELYNGTEGNPKPVKFATVDYSTCGSENGVAIKIGMVSGHGNGVNYKFLQDVIINVFYLGTVVVNNFKYYGEATKYNGQNRQFGDIFYVVDIANKIVDFYCLMGQYARVNMTPYKRVTYSTGGNITQHKNATIYSEGTIEWANNNEFAMLNDLPSTETWTFIVDNGDGTTTEVPKEVYVK